MQRIGVFCKDDFLFQKIKLILNGKAECVRLTEIDGGDGVALRLVDRFEGYLPVGAVTMSRSTGADLKIPFTSESLLRIVNERTVPNKLINLDTGCRLAHFKGKAMKLTELEFSLLKLLLSEKRYFAKEEILSRVWDSHTDVGIVNVYIHYLREKLECDGERVIISSRGRGYKIEEKFLGKEEF